MLDRMKIYLAGAIRDGNAYDIEWRSHASSAFRSVGGRVLNPLSGQYETREGWFFNGVPAAPCTMVPRDLHLLRQADAVFANLLPMSDGYRSLGTIMELGVALERRQLVVIVGAPEITDHPFLSQLAYATFLELDPAIDFFVREIDSLRLR